MTLEQLDRGGLLIREIWLVIPAVFLQGSLEVIILLTGKSIRKGDSNTHPHPLLLQETANPLTLQATELLLIEWWLHST